MSETNYTEIDFDSVGAKLRGRLYRSSNAKAPLVVMAHGFTATAHMSLYKFAERLAGHGNHTLVYDHRNFGLSDGTPRYAVDQWVQIRGYTDAISAALNMKDLTSEEIVVWGESMSGAMVHFVAAFDDRVSAVIAHTPGCGDSYVNPEADGGDYAALHASWEHADLTDEPVGSVPLRFADLPTSDAPIRLDFTEATQYAQAYGMRKDSMWSNDVTFVSRDAPQLTVPVVAAQLNKPTLYLVASDDEVVNASPAVARQCFDSIPAAKTWVDITGGHFGLLYEDSDIFNQAVAADQTFLDSLK